MARSDYSHGSHTTKVIRASRARCGARSVLLALIARAEYQKPEVTITKAQIARLTGLERKAVQKALVFLRSEKTIVPIAHFEGGRGNAVTYRLEIVGQGAETPDSNAGAGPKRVLDPAEFGRIMKADGIDAAMAAKKAYEE